LDLASFLAFLAARFSISVLPCFLFCPEGGALSAIPKAYVADDGR
jgi:hypothetical protein